MAYTFPRVNTTILARTRTSTVYVENPKIPVLFATIVSDKGPYAITKVHNLTEFKEKYGELSFAKQGQDVLNLYQWLGNLDYNGYAWIKRIEPAFVSGDTYVEDVSKLASAEARIATDGDNIVFNFIAKEPGELYTKYKIQVNQRRNSSGKFLPEFNITTYNELGKVIDQVKGLNGENKEDSLSLLKYFDGEIVTTGFPTGESNTSVFDNSVGSDFTNPELVTSGTKVASGITDDLDPDTIFKAISVYYRTKARIELEDALSYPISMILDGNYPIVTKKDIVDFVRDVRDDVHFMLTRAKYKETIDIVDASLTLDEMSDAEVTELLTYDWPINGNVSIWAPDFEIVSDPEVTGTTTVSSIYELAYKIPYNDYNYGIWWNFVGPRRGVIKGELLHTNTSLEKENYVKTLTNYVEKTDRDKCFMLQRTTAPEDTAHAQLHASRLTQYLRREIKWIGRRYLFEYNDIDSTTYNDCKKDIREFLNKFASIAIDMSNPYVLDVYKTGDKSFQIDLMNLKYKDVVETVDLNIELV